MNQYVLAQWFGYESCWQIMYVSSAYLQNILPGVMAFRSAASTTNMAGPIAELWIMLAVISHNSDNSPL